MFSITLGKGKSAPIPPPGGYIRDTGMMWEVWGKRDVGFGLKIPYLVRLVPKF